MKPSDAKAVAGARLLFRVSEGLEPFTAKLVEALPKSVQVVTLLDAPGLDLLERRESGAFEGHADHGHAKHGAKGKAATSEDERDPHVWLDPANAAKLVDHIAAVLSAADPANATAYAANAAVTRARIDALAGELDRQFAAVRGQPFIVLHDAYRYLERRFGLTAVGSIAVSPETAPSGKRLAAIRRKIADSKAACVFAEPGMQPKVVAAVVEATPARVATLDPEATQLSPGAGLYGDLMRGLAAAITSCLASR
jgi:zinc transport system substrate-binding protein